MTTNAYQKFIKMVLAKPNCVTPTTFHIINDFLIDNAITVQEFASDDWLPLFILMNPDQPRSTIDNFLRANYVETSPNCEDSSANCVETV